MRPIQPGGFTERSIASYLARFIFERKHLVIVPNCQFPGSECDLLAITPNLRIIDVEIKISRADLRADAKKAKWFHDWDWKIDGPYFGREHAKRRQRQWPARVWKHYYCLPRSIWTPELKAEINPVSGILLIQDRDDGIRVAVERQAKPDRGADRLTAEDAVNIARLASLRMWDAFEHADRVIADSRKTRLLYSQGKHEDAHA